MASVNFKKLHTVQDVAAMLRHSCSDTRMQHKHSNRDIDKSLTPGNLDTGSYGASLSRYKSRIEYLDKQPGQNRRADRVTCFGLELPAPAGIPREQQVDFLRHAARLISDWVSARNVVSASVHVDEIKQYLDHGEVKESRPHLHMYVVPEISGKLNGKAFSSRSRMQTLNRDLDQMCRSRYGVPYMTGEKARQMSVEQLKVSSAIEVSKMAAEASEKLSKAVQKKKRIDQSVKDKTALYERLEAKYEHVQQELPKVSKRLRELREDRDEIKRYLMGTAQQRDMMHFMEQYQIGQKPLSDVYVDYVQEQLQLRREQLVEEDDDPWGDGIPDR